MSETAGKVFGVIGKAAGILDAGIAIKDAIDDPTAGNIAKATFKTVLAFAKVNPVINVISAVMDITGVTDALFKW